MVVLILMNTLFLRAHDTTASGKTPYFPLLGDFGYWVRNAHPTKYIHLVPTLCVGMDT